MHFPERYSLYEVKCDVCDDSPVYTQRYGKHLHLELAEQVAEDQVHVQRLCLHCRNVVNHVYDIEKYARLVFTRIFSMPVDYNGCTPEKLQQFVPIEHYRHPFKKKS